MCHDDDLSAVSKRCRRRILKMIHDAGAGHPGGSLSVIDILTVIFCRFLSEDGRGKDRVVLSKGHAVPALYALLCEQGELEESLLPTYRHVDSPLEGHPWSVKLPGAIDATTGLLGQGLSMGLGMALAKRLKGDPHRVFVIVGDGEMEVGQLWEAAMAAGRFRVSNLICIVDRNGLSSHGPVEDIEPLGARLSSFGWECREVDGHDFGALEAALRASESEAPLFVIARTVKGKGVPFMENVPMWHSHSLSDRELGEALAAIGEES